MNRLEDRVRELIVSRYGSIAKFAASTGIPKTTIYSSLDRGLGSTNIDIVLALCSELDIDANALSEGLIVERSEPRIYTLTAPLYGSIAAGEPFEMIPVDENIPLPSEVIARHPEGFFLSVKGESMNKVIPNGAYAFVDPTIEPDNGDIAVVIVNGDEATLKRIYKTDNSVILSPSSMDESFKDKVYDSNDPATPDIRVLGKVVWYMVPFGFEL